MERERITELQHLLSEALAIQTKQDRRLAQLTDELALKSALLEQAKTNAAEAKRTAELERRENANRLLVQTSLAKQKDAELEKLRAKLAELSLTRAQDVRAPEQARSPLQISDKYQRSQHAFEQVAKYETELAEVRAELEAKMSELEAVRSRLTDAEKSRVGTWTGLQDLATLWRNKYEALAKLYSQLRTEHIDLLMQLKASAQTTAGEFVRGRREEEQSGNGDGDRIVPGSSYRIAK